MMYISDTHQIIDFGKYKGRSIKDLLTIDPEYLIWAHKTTTHFTMSENMLRIVAQTKLPVKPKPKKIRRGYSYSDDYEVYDDGYDNELFSGGEYDF